MTEFPYLGHGIGLRAPHYPQVVGQHPAGIDWFEVISENFMVAGGNPRHVLRQVRQRWPVVLHGVSLSIGSVDPLNQRYLDDLAALAAEIEPAWISDHLCWSSYGGHTGHDLWPLPFTEEALVHIAERIQIVQVRLRRPILIENVSSYLEFSHSMMPEWEFLSELTRRSDCGLLLDVNNVFVSAHNHGFDPAAFLAGVPASSVKQIHLAGHRDEGTHLLDTHDHPVCDGVWSLYRAAVERFGAVSTLIERDDDIPPLAEVIAESRQAASIQAEALASRAARAQAKDGALAPGRADVPLADVQRRLYDLITAPEGVGARLRELGRAPESLEDIVRPTARLSAVERVDVYADMYFYRILEVLRDEFPRLLAALGDRAFHNLITGYLLDCRPAHPSLREAGGRLPEYLSRHVLAQERPWLAELARLERTHFELHDGPDAEVLTLEQIQAQPPEALPGLLLRAVPCHALLANRYTLSALWTALDGVSAGAAPSAAAPAASPETLLIWRQGLGVDHRIVDPDEEPLISALRDGARFELLCERLLESVGPEQAAPRAFTLLARWIGERLIARPEFPPAI